MPCLSIRFNLEKDRASLMKMLDERRRIGLSEEDSGIESKVRAILDNVRLNGLDAVLEYTRNFDCESFREDQFALNAEDLENAARSVDQQDLEIFSEAIHNIRSFHEKQRANSWFQTSEDGSLTGQLIRPVSRAGLYVPGGRGGDTPLISSLLMTAIPAQVAGVASIAVVSPPRPDGTINPYIAAVAKLLGITEVYACGSAWAVAALAYGAGPVKPVDIIAGPGNIFVSTAKRLLIGQVGIDMIAGPSEITILADKNADPAWIAADMLSQAEHDSLASSVCVCIGHGLTEPVKKELKRQLDTLPRADMARQSLNKFGAVVEVDSLESGLDLVNSIAPEHLELMLADPWTALPGIRNAGAVFMGNHSPEALGDYFAGPNHVLPTMGTARFAQALGVDTFYKKISLISASPAFSAANAESIARMARLEALEAHARSAELRGGK